MYLCPPRNIHPKYDHEGSLQKSKNQFQRSAYLLDVHNKFTIKAYLLMIFIWHNLGMKLGYSNIFKTLEKLNLKYLIYERKIVDIKGMKDQLMNMQNDMWKQAVPKNSRLKTYCLFKETMNIENCIKNKICHPLKDLQ